MQNKKERLLEKIVKKNYNNELEEILETKDFSENAKSTLLSIFYKIEMGYKDVVTIKRDVETKEEFISTLINIIKKQCDSIEILKMTDKTNKIPQNRTYMINREKKEIIAYPIERKILYALAKMENKEKILRDEYFLIDETISDLINVGKNIEVVETLRDFNGYSWTTITEEIESIDHNLIYQNLRILIGHNLLDKWVKNNEFIIDYYDLLKNELETKYGKETQKNIIDVISQLSILLEMKFEPSIKEKYNEQLKEIEDKLDKIDNKEKFITQTTKEKIKITEQIRNIDTIINNKLLLEKEYENRNEKLSLEKKIFSMKVLTKIMIDEREEKLNRIEKLNKIINPSGFIKYKQNLENKYEYIKLLKVENLEEKIKELKVKMQLLVIKCIQKQIKQSETKQELIDIIYQYRYYMMLPFDKENNIKDIKELQTLIKEIGMLLINKANEEKVLQQISTNKENNYQILSNIFKIRMIRLENSFIKITKEKEKFYLQILDEDAFEEKIEIDKPEELEIKLNKKTPIW